METRIRTILKYGLALLLLSLWLAPATFAQGRGFNPEQMKKRMAEQNDELIKYLNLTDEKASVVRPILEASQQKRMDLMKDRTNREAMRAKMDEINKETEALLIGVLSSDEMKAYKKWQEEHRQQRPRGPRQGGSL